MPKDILATIDAEIAKLQQARALLASVPDALAGLNTGRDRPKGLKNVRQAEIVSFTKKAKRVMSDETRAKMAQSQQKRHAAKRKAAKKAARLASLEAKKPVEEMIVEEPVA